MKILLDENVDNRIRKVLESEGFTVSTVFEEDLVGRKDLEIADYCVREELPIITHDDDFLSLKKEEKRKLCVVYLPQVINFKEMKERVKELSAGKLENSKTVYL